MDTLSIGQNKTKVGLKDDNGECLVLKRYNRSE